MNDETDKSEPTLIEKWIRDQQEWQRTTMEYFDSMVKNDDFLTHLGNAMRGSLLAGKPYPGTEPAEGPSEIAVVQDRMDEVLHTLHQLQGELADLKLEIAELKSRPVAASPVATPAEPQSASPDSVSGDSGRGGD